MNNVQSKKQKPPHLKKTVQTKNTNSKKHNNKKTKTLKPLYLSPQPLLNRTNIKNL